MIFFFVKTVTFDFRQSFCSCNIRQNQVKMKANVLRLIPLLFIVVMAASSCEKKGPCEAVITVTDSLGRKVAGALVVLRQDSVINPTNGTQAVINEVRTSNSSGQAMFTFKLEAVLILEATKGPFEGRDYVRLEQSETVQKTVIIR
jgi:hypothetical protein